MVTIVINGLQKIRYIILRNQKKKKKEKPGKNDDRIQNRLSYNFTNTDGRRCTRICRSEIFFIPKTNIFLISKGIPE